jgi:rfaE bifunctional protein nucleotidyltransferase chain/domain
MGAQTTNINPKVVAWDELMRLRERWQQQGKTVVWTNGCFDLLHVGHARNLQAASRLGDVLVVGLNSDDSVRRLKGSGRPIVPAGERAELLAALECVDAVVVFDELTPEVSLARLQPEVHCKGEDYAPPHGKAFPEGPVVESYGGRIAFLPLVPSISTTALMERIHAAAVKGSLEKPRS